MLPIFIWGYAFIWDLHSYAMCIHMRSHRNTDTHATKSNVLKNNPKILGIVLKNNPEILCNPVYLQWAVLGLYATLSICNGL